MSEGDWTSVRAEMRKLEEKVDKLATKVAHLEAKWGIGAFLGTAAGAFAARLFGF